MSNVDAVQQARQKLDRLRAMKPAPQKSSMPARPASEPPSSAGPAHSACAQSPELVGANRCSALDFALAYAALGWHVLPVNAKTKKPLGGQGIDHATTDEAAVRGWFRQWPEAGVGIHLAPSGLCAIDIDPRNGATNIPRDFPATLKARTGGGGFHLVYRAPSGVSLPGKLGPGIDIKHRGYIIVEPSAHPSGGRYEWDGFSPLSASETPAIAEFPVELLNRQKNKSNSPQPVLTGVVPEGARNEYLSTEAFRLRKQGLSIDAIYEVIAAMNSSVCNPALDDAEVRAIAEGKKHVQSDRQDVLDEFGVLEHSPVAEQAIAPRPSLTFLSGREFRSWPAPTWIVKGVIPKSELVAVFGASGAGKSFLALDIVAAVQRGVAWRGLKVRKGRVGYVAAEGAGGFRNRLEAYCRHHQVDLDIRVLPTSPNLLKVDRVRALIEAAKAAGSFDLIVIDTLAQSAPGMDENSAEDMGVLVAACKALHRESGATVLLVHHAGKDPARGMRGSSAFLAACDAVIEVTRQGEQRIAKVVKQKDGTDGAEYAFRLDVIAIGEDEEGEIIDSCVLEHLGEVRRTRAGPKGKNERLVLDAIKSLLVLAKEGSAVPVGEVLDAAVENMVPPQGKDRRRERAREGLEGLQNGRWVRLEGGYCRLEPT